MQRGARFAFCEMHAVHSRRDSAGLMRKRPFEKKALPCNAALVLFEEIAFPCSVALVFHPKGVP